MIHIFHRWSKWGEPFDVEKSFVRIDGQSPAYAVTMQRRVCVVCGAVQERRL